MPVLGSVLRRLLPVLDRLKEARVTAVGRRITVEFSGTVAVRLGIGGDEHDVERATLRLELLGPDRAVLQDVRVVLRSGLKRAGYAMAGGDRAAASALVKEAQKAGLVGEVRWAGNQPGALPAEVTLVG